MKLNFLMGTIAMVTLATSCTTGAKHNQLTPQERQRDGNSSSTAQPSGDGAIITATASSTLVRRGWHDTGQGEGADEHGYIVTERSMKILNWCGIGRLPMAATAASCIMWWKIRNLPSPMSRDLNIS